MGFHRRVCLKLCTYTFGHSYPSSSSVSYPRCVRDTQARESVVSGGYLTAAQQVTIYNSAEGGLTYFSVLYFLYWQPRALILSPGTDWTGRPVLTSRLGLYTFPISINKRKFV